MKRNLLNPSLKQIKERAELWAKALEANKRKARKTMKDGHGGRCCLQVAQDVAKSCGVVMNVDKYSLLPTRETARFFGWENTNPIIASKTQYKTASDINDYEVYNKRDTGLPHKEIAKLVRETFCQ